MQVLESVSPLFWGVATTATLWGVWRVIRFLRSRKAKKPKPDLSFSAVDAGAHARQIALEQGMDQAKQVVLETYRAELEQLDAKQKKEAARLAEDPAALARFLVRSRSRK